MVCLDFSEPEMCISCENSISIFGVEYITFSLFLFHKGQDTLKVIRIRPFVWLIFIWDFIIIYQAITNLFPNMIHSLN